MKKTTKIVSIIVAVCVLLLGSVMVASAAVRPSFPYHSSNQLAINDEWKPIATSTEGFSCQIVVAAFTETLTPIDIRMLGRTGNVVWQEDAAVSNMYPRTFDCGADVYSVEIRTRGGRGYAWAGYVSSLQ